MSAAREGYIVLFGIILLLVFGGCTGSKAPREEGTQIVVSIEPQAYIVKRVGGPTVTVNVLVPAGQSPATYEPTPKQMAALEKSDVYFRTGVPFESRFLGRVAKVIGRERIVDMREGIRLRSIGHHDHGEGGEPHDGEQPDPHVWLDPQLVKTQAATVAGVLQGLTPGHSDEIAANLRAFQHDLDSVDAVIAGLLEPYRGRSIYVFHPSYGYFTDRYGLTQVAVEFEGKEPSGRHLAELVERARGDGVRAVFVQRQFSQKTAETIAAAIGAEVVSLDPLSGDYLNNLTVMAERIAAALAPEGSP